MLKPLLQRIRDVRQGPDGLLYLLTDSGDDRLLRVEPANRENPTNPLELFEPSEPQEPLKPLGTSGPVRCRT
jgi:hypothetical protein